MGRKDRFPGIGERVRDLLEDFEVVGTVAEIALISRYPERTALHENMHAAIVASTFGLSSIDYAKRKYCRSEKKPQHHPPKSEPSHVYINAYLACKQYVWRMVEKIKTDGLPQPSNGVFGASLVLERLPYSFFSAHILYRLGHRYEGHAVARLILEQIAWAYAAYTMDDLEDIDRIVTTKSISRLKSFVPETGILYGFLSDKTHIDYRNHPEFIQTDTGKNVIVYAQPVFKEYAIVMLNLADLFGIVWEVSQLDYLAEVEAIRVSGDDIALNPSRPFLVEKQKLLEEFDEIEDMSKK